MGRRASDALRPRGGGAGALANGATPYLRAILDALSVTSALRRIVVMKGAQLGFTEAAVNWLGYVIHHAPGPFLFVEPTVELAKRLSRSRIDPLIEDSAPLRERVKRARSRDAGNTVLLKEFPGGLVVLTGANSAVGLRSMAARFLCFDEVDAYPGDVDGEGDPIALAEARARTFPRRKLLLISTPTVAGVYHRIELPLGPLPELQAGLLPREVRRRARALEAFALHQGGYSYGEIAAALEIGKTTAFRHVREARQQCREVAAQLGTILPEE